MEEITREELKELDRDSYELIDIRDDGLIAYGMIDGALHIEIGDLLDTDKIDKIDKSKKLVFYCEIGRMSRDIDDSIGCLANRECYSLAEGYVGYVRSKVKSDSDIKAKTKKAEESIRKKYHKQLFSPLLKLVKTISLLKMEIILQYVFPVVKTQCLWQSYSRKYKDINKKVSNLLSWLWIQAIMRKIVH